MSKKSYLKDYQIETPLNAPERRRSLPGNMPKVVTDLSKHKLFEELNNIQKRQDILDKADRMLCLMLIGRMI